MYASTCGCLNQSSLFVTFFLKICKYTQLLSAHYKIVSDVKIKLRIAVILEGNKTNDLWENEREIIIHLVLAVTPS